MMPMGRDVNPALIEGTREHAEEVTRNRVRPVRDALQWLTFSHLPEKLQNYSRPFYRTAVEMIQIVSDVAELTHTLNALIQAKDWAVRAGIHSDTGRAGSVPRPQTVVNPPVFGHAQVPARPDQQLPEGNYGAGQPMPRPIRDEPQA
jgi:hypothetical protein